MLKVVGASWLQTRISTYILVAVAVLGIGAIILGEFGQVENDGTYSATVYWKQKGGYRIDFWGQGNDLKTIPLGAARAYYKTGIYETGWSVVEIETSEDYPDMVQAYSAGLLEGSLTWQLIHHHWFNTVRAACAPRASLCRKMRRYLRENSAATRERAELFHFEDPFWHVVRLFYAQLDGIEAGWRFAVRRSRQSVEIESEDFLWLAVASDLSDLERALNGSNRDIDFAGMILLKALPQNTVEPQVTLAHSTGAPYARMLRLLKRYDFAFHVSPAKDASTVPGRSIIMSSYPGALSSQDEYYAVQGDQKDLLVAGTPLPVNNRNLSIGSPREHVMSSLRIMVANRLATDGRTWSKLMSRKNGETNRQWLVYDPSASSIWLMEQTHGMTRSADYSEKFAESGFLTCTGVPYFKEIRDAVGFNRDDLVRRQELVTQLQQNITDSEQVNALMRGCSLDGDLRSNDSLDISQTLSYRGDIATVARPMGVIDAKIFLATGNGLETMLATSGPRFNKDVESFDWRKNFSNMSHIGHPDVFNFQSVSPMWVWI